MSPAASPGSSTVAIALVDDDQIILEGLRSMVGPHGDRVTLLGQLGVTEDLSPMAEELGADIVLVEVRPMGSKALDLASRLAAVDPPFRVVIFTYDESEANVLEALRLGISGYLLKSSSAEVLVDHLVRIARGEVVVDPSVATQITVRTAQRTGRQQWPGRNMDLSRRESEVLGLLVRGMSNRAIAAYLRLGEETVKTHLRNVYKKLGVRDRTQAVARAVREGLFN